MKQLKINFIAIVLAIFLLTPAALAQTTVFTFQGKLQSSSAPANGNFDFEFLLFDAVGGGSQIGLTITRNGVSVADGIFSVNLDFGTNFPGASRFLEIRVRQTGGGAFTQLTPRQPVTSTPYSVKSLTSDSATNAVNAANATTALNFSNPLAGDVTGNQGATTVQRIRNLPVPAPVQADDGKVLRYKNDGVNPAAFELATVSGGGGGTITGVTAGTGLTGGGATGTVTVGIAPGGVGTNEIANNAVTDAKIAPSTITAPKIASGQVVKSLNSLSDAVTLTAGSNITITPSGNTLTIASTGASNPILNQTAQQAGANFNISGNGLIAGNVGIGTTNPQAKLDVNGTVQIASGGSGGQVVFAAPNGESGMLISGTSRADIRFDGSTLKLLAGVSTGAPISTNGIAIATSGNVGIGTTNPTTKLHVLTSVAGASAFTGESSSGPGVYGKSTSSRGVFGESASGRGVFGQSTSGEGVLGVSTSSAGVSGGSTSGSGVYGESAVVNSLTAAGVYGKATSSGGIGVIGESNVANAVGVFGVSTSPGGVAVYARNNSGGRAIFAEGNVAQGVASNGLVKAMISVDDTGSIDGCYNGITNSSSGNCGFTITKPLGDVGVYRINYGFPVAGRFVSVTAEYFSFTFGGGNNNSLASYRFFGSTSVEVFTFQSGSADTTVRSFTIIMY